MDIILWVIASLLAVCFLLSGVVKLVRRKEELVASDTGAALAGFSPTAIKAIGTLEVLAAVGLVGPAALGVAPVLVPLAATGLVLLMVGAIATHTRRREAGAVVVTLVLLTLAAVVACGRLGPWPLG